MKKQIIKDIECDETGIICDPDCDSCCNAAGDSQWVEFDGHDNYIRGPECITAGKDLDDLRVENQFHRDFIEEENEELTNALEKIGILKELLEELVPLAFPKKVVYTAEQAGKIIALKDRVFAALKGDIT